MKKDADMLGVLFYVPQIGDKLVFSNSQKH